MDYYNYPLDTEVLLRKKRQIRNELLNVDREWLTKKIAVLGGSTTNEFVDQMELALLNQGIRPLFYQSEYGKYYEDALFGNDELDSFAPDLIYIHTNWRNISVFPKATDSLDDINLLAENETKKLFDMWDKLTDKFNCPIIQNNFDRPSYRLLGNMDICDVHGRGNYIFRLNSIMYDYAGNHAGFYINDIDYISYQVGETEWNVPLYWYLYKYFCGVHAIPYVALSIARIIKAIYGKNKKVMVLDLDNTIWGGIAGDDGAENILVGQGTPRGEAFLEFQEYCKIQQEKGVLLAVVSKNDEKNARACLERRDCLLKPDDFVSFKANWERKDNNLKEIAEELSLGLDSMVFLDDSPVERELVRSNLHEVEVPEIGNIENYIKCLEFEGYFETISLSKEDMEKTKQYIERKNVINQIMAYDSYDEFLKSLEMEAEISDFQEEYIHRISQLTNKTNQFNLTTKRCSESDIVSMQKNPNYICLCARLKDKFVDNGVVTVVAGEIIDNSLHIRLWLMSCRVLKRNLEQEMMNELMRIAKSRGVERVIGYYHQTAKNGMVKYFYKEMGFDQNEEDNDRWELRVDDYTERKSKIMVLNVNFP